MLAPWLLYSTWLGAMFCLVGLLGDRVVRRRGDATRWLWLVLIVTMPIPPILFNLFPAGPAISPATAVFSMVMQTPLVAPPIDPAPSRHNYDTPLLALWLLASSLVALRILGGAVVLRRRRRSWIAATFGGHAVLLTDDLGPAVIGWPRFTTVIPRWALTFDERSRELMLAHEAEHASSGDPYLRSVALLALILMPWNPALWFAARRLRLAIEMDCDQRVLARGADPQQYASLLLAVGERMSATPFAWATALGGTRSLLETRVRGMVAPWVPRHPRLAIGSLIVAATLIAVAACSAPVPDPVVVAARDLPDTLSYVCKAGSACADSSVHKYVNWVIRARSFTDAKNLQVHGRLRADCGAGKRDCGYILEGKGTDTLFVDTKSGKVWSSGNAPDDLEVGNRTVTVDRFGTNCTDKSDCGRGTEPTFTGIIARSMNIFAKPAPDFVVVREVEVPICTSAQAAAKRRATSTGGFSPRCIIE